MTQSTHLTFKFSIDQNLELSKLRMTMLGAALPREVADMIFVMLDDTHKEIAYRLTQSKNNKREVRHDNIADAGESDS